MSDGFLGYDGERDAEFREAIYGGSILRIPSTDVSLQLASLCRDQAIEILGKNPLDPSLYPRAATEAGDSGEEERLFFRKMGTLRRRLYESKACRDAIAKLIESLGLIASEHVYDAARSRLISVDGHLSPAAASVYYAHRDTWYANPPSQITWWMPLHDVTADHTFEWLPEYFARPVRNDSHTFDYDRWTSKGKALQIGLQDADAGRRETYPRLQETLADAQRIGFDARFGEVIVFSGQHLHQTRCIDSGTSRLSIDFRTIHVGDYHDAKGPRNVDNRSTGDAFSGHAPLFERDQVK